MTASGGPGNGALSTTKTKNSPHKKNASWRELGFAGEERQKKHKKKGIDRVMGGGLLSVYKCWKKAFIITAC